MRGVAEPPAPAPAPARERFLLVYDSLRNRGLPDEPET
jgi:hypothetical protein